MIRVLTPKDAEIWRKLRLEMLSNDPTMFGSTLADVVDQPVAYFQEFLTNVTILGAFDGELIGSIGWHIGRSATTAHSGNVIAAYVQPEARRLGHLGRLIDALISDATGQVVQLELRVVSSNVGAIKAYEAKGFETCGQIPRALCHEGVYSDELHMVRRLDA
ncbi:GNAT family N-acetyltransferase [Amylibacter sp.]|nr:GNAT family N-acetyltransferase [Amylibacter sp.]